MQPAAFHPHSERMENWGHLFLPENPRPLTVPKLEQGYCHHAPASDWLLLSNLTQQVNPRSDLSTHILSYASWKELQKVKQLQTIQGTFWKCGCLLLPVGCLKCLLPMRPERIRCFHYWPVLRGEVILTRGDVITNSQWNLRQLQRWASLLSMWAAFVPPGTRKSVTDCITLFALATRKLRAPFCMPTEPPTCTWDCDLYLALPYLSVGIFPFVTFLPIHF